jgi:hypothetical protein
MPIPTTPLNLKVKAAGETWEQMLTALVLWIENNGDLPKQSATGTHGKSLYRWLRDQRMADRTGTLSADRLNTMNRLLPDWKSKNHDMSAYRENKVTAIIEWYNQHGALPRKQKTSGEEELVLNGHLLRLQTIAKGGRGVALAQEYADLFKKLDEAIPNWHSKDSYYGTKRSWDVAAADFVQWVNAHDRLPAWNAKSNAEKMNFRWLVQMRTASQGNGTRRWDDAYGEFLDEFVPGWRGTN